MERIITLSGLVDIDVFCDESVPWSDREDLLLGAYVPGVVCADRDSGKRDGAITVIHRETQGAAPSFFASKNGVYELRDAWRGVFPMYFFHFLYALTRNSLLVEGVICLHSALVSLGGRNTLILGHTGDGKSTVSLRLSEAYGFRLASTNKTAVALSGGSPVALGGTSTVSVLDEKNGSLWSRKLFSRNGEKRGFYAGMMIDSIVVIKLNNWKSGFVRLPLVEALVRILPFWGDGLNGHSILFDGAEVFGFPESAPIREAQYQDAVSLVKKVPIYLAVGSLDPICANITSLHA